MAKVVIYARVSTQGQDYERQLAELREYARILSCFRLQVSCGKWVILEMTRRDQAGILRLLSSPEKRKSQMSIIVEGAAISLSPNYNYFPLRLLNT